MNCDHRAPAYMLQGESNREDFAKMVEQAREAVKRAAEVPANAARMVTMLAAAGLYDRVAADDFVQILKELSSANEQICIRLYNLSARVATHH